MVVLPLSYRIVEVTYMLWPGRAYPHLANPMRIGLVCPTSPFPAKCGVGDYTRVLAQSLAKQGHQVK